MNELPRKESNIFYPELKNLFGLPDFILPEQRMAHEAEILGHPIKRVGGKQLRIIRPQGKNKSRHYVTFEIHPPWKPEFEEYETGNEEYLPF